MRRTSLISCVLLIIMMFATLLIFALINVKRTYQSDSAKIQTMLADRSIVNYFTTEQLETSYKVGGVDEEVITNPICIDCDETIANMYNSQSVLIESAPDSLCDTEVERCILYNYDPFGLGIFEKQEILRSKK